MLLSSTECIGVCVCVCVCLREKSHISEKGKEVELEREV